MKTEFLGIIPVLPSANIARDIAWYKEKAGFEVRFSDSMYAAFTETVFIYTYNGMPIRKVTHYLEVRLLELI